MNSISITDEFSYKSVFNSLSASPDFNELIDLRTKILASESVIVVFKSLYYFMNIVNVKFPTENADKDISLVYMSSLDIYAQNAHYLFKYGQTNELIEFLKIKSWRLGASQVKR